MEPTIHWRNLQLFGGNDAPISNPNAIRMFLDEFRRTGSMSRAFFARTGAPHEDPEDASTWGPKSPDHVDWTGFASALEHSYPCGCIIRSDVEMSTLCDEAKKIARSMRDVSGVHLGKFPLMAHVLNLMTHYGVSQDEVEPFFRIARISERGR